jgi:hypothetical protein
MLTLTTDMFKTILISSLLSQASSSSKSLLIIIIIVDTAGNQTVTANDILLFLNQSNFDIYADHWNEQGPSMMMMMMMMIMVVIDCIDDGYDGSSSDIY